VTWAGLATTGLIQARVKLADGTVHRAAAWRRRNSSLTARCGPLDIELRLGATAEAAQMALSARARAEVTVTEIGLEMTPQICGSVPDWVVYNGYHSWDAAGVAPAGKHQSWWTVGVADDAGAGLAASATAARKHTTRFDWEDGHLLLTTCEFPGLKQNPPMWQARRGDAWAADGLQLAAAADVRAALRRAARGPRRRNSASVPRGWLSWYHYGPWISAGEVLENSTVLSHGRLRSLGYRVILVDDGWQQAYGDWSPNSKFPGGMSALATELAARDQRLGVWTAPFLVSASSDLATQAPPEWFVLDPTSGERAVDPVHVVFGPMYVLDARHPGVRKHLTSTFARLRAEGVDYFKIDFLYAGAYAGTAALRAGLQAIRRGAGDGYLLASGAPLLSVAGLCEACRTTRDTASPIFDFELGSPKPTLIGDEVIEVGRNQAARHFLDSWFHLDADVALVGGNLSPEQGRTLVTVAALSGGPFFASDHLAALEPERLALLVNPRVLELVGARPAAPDWEPTERDRASAIWRRDGVVGVFNWDWEEREVVVPVKGRRRARDLWQDRDLGLVEGELRLQVPAAGARLVALAEA
jgi:Melibiase